MRAVGLWVSRCAGVALALTTALASTGCVEDLRATLVPLFGCGIEGEITELVLTARGDFAPADAPPVRVNEGTGSLAELPDAVRGVTVEGLFGQSTVVAVGRTARLHDEGELAVYFSPRDRLCPVESDLPGRDVGAMAVGELGDVVVVGGIDVDLELSRDILHYRDIEGELRLGVGQLPWASRAQTVHPLGGRRFIAIGGTTAEDHVLARAVAFEVGDTEADVVVGDTIDLSAAAVPDPYRAHHAGAVLDDGRILVTGGCAATAMGECAPVIDGAIGTAYFVEPSGTGVRFDTDVPPFIVPRFGHSMLVSRDGIVFAVGGFDYIAGIDGLPLRSDVPTIELLLPGLASWAPYGPALTSAIADADIVGATLIEGGLIVVVTSLGRIWIVDEYKAWELRNWCTDPEGPDESTPPCFLDNPLGGSQPGDSLPHTLLTLPGERVLADNFLLPVAQVGRDGFGAVDISSDALSVDPPPGARADAKTAVLDDGTVLIAGGRAPATSALASPVLLRFRPELDGPDEREPVLEGLPPGSLMMHDGRSVNVGELVLQRTDVVDGTLVLRPDRDLSTSLVGVWAHVRAFLSRRFRLQATIGTTGAAFPRFVFSQGAIARNVLAIDPDEIRFLVREPGGGSFEITCADRGLDFLDALQQVVIDVSPDAVEVRHRGQAIARCPWAGDLPVSVGIGAVGDGTVTARSLGLSRG
jgi:hypothetical protein